MLIGLVRHFKVDIPFTKTFYTPEEFNKQMSDYDTAGVIPNEVNLGNYDWNICYASNLPRAITTAKTIYKEEIITTPHLREVPINAFINIPVRLPAPVWHISARIAWKKNSSSQPETYNQTMERINKIYNTITSNGYENILIVSHGFFMRVFHNFLTKKGFEGEIDFSPRNGKLYTLTR